MSTDNHIFPTVEQQMQAITLDYAPLFSTLPAQAHEAKIENVKFTTVRGDDEIVAKPLNAQDTERAHIKAGESSKEYAKSFKGVEYVESTLNARSAMPGINNKAIKALTKQLDKEIWNGTDNNGIVNSSDENLLKEEAFTLDGTGSAGLNQLLSLGAYLKRLVEKTSSSSYFTLNLYGDKMKDYMLKVLDNGSTFGQIFRQAFPNIQLVEVPANLETTNNGIVLICPQIVTLHHTALPQIKASGTDARTDEVWTKYYYGTAMVDVKEQGGIIVQPVTIS